MGRIGDILSRCGLSEREFASVRYEMQEKNRRMLALISSIAAVSFLCIFLSSMVSGGSVVPGDIAAYIPGGILGAALGAALLKIISPKWLKRVFALFMLYTSYRLMFG